MNLSDICIIFAHSDKRIIKSYEKHFSGVSNVQVIKCPLFQITTADCIICPGNSFGFIQSGLDKSISTIINGIDNKIKNVIDEIHYGEQPIGVTFILPTQSDNYPFIGYTPIIRNNKKDNEKDNLMNHYFAFRSILTSVLNHNKFSDKKIKTILCPPFNFNNDYNDNIDESVRLIRVAFGLIDIGLNCSKENSEIIDKLLF